MTTKSLPTKKNELELVQEQFEKWRSSPNKKKPIPNHLWQLAINLCEKYLITQVCKTLRLNHSDLKKKIAQSKSFNEIEDKVNAPQFIELEFSKSVVECETIIEMENLNDSSKMKMSFKGDLPFEILTLTQQFWGRVK